MVSPFDVFRFIREANGFMNLATLFVNALRFMHELVYM